MKLNRKSPYVRRDVPDDIKKYLVKKGWKRIQYNAEYARYERNGVPLTEMYLGSFSNLSQLLTKQPILAN